mmetsp:Transcript_70990/g.140976  ORF Transcript_70990/g.140976 Transcript_70990/m.140976 type:complete len:135 (+) Transcript_70990:61-465(+)
MGAMSYRPAQPMQPAAVPVFYTTEFLNEYGSANLPVPNEPAAPPVDQPPPTPTCVHDLKAAERDRILAELRDEELCTAEVTAQRIGSWAAKVQARPVPCLTEQLEVERCYASPPGGDQLRCGPVVEAYVQCAKV